ncbi:hypothetical protein QYE76_025499 [Lolium multiflorum]|uniref:Uncharacterized protein n=1 Tax=Lolium multiflorum TaxID=4521 RepID=A0AAD8VUC0_LOLMU|nr:hypothetical protein QYE76_025499 [Lolium multiflorum]
MASSSSSLSSTAAVLLVCAMLLQTCQATRRLTALVQDPPMTMEYHKGALLTGRIAINLVWYGDFTAAQRAALTDFLSSLSPTTTTPQPSPSVATWFSTAHKYYATSNTPFPTLSLATHVTDTTYSLGKHLKEPDLLTLAARGGRRRAINVVLTAADVAVAGFCSSRCGSHGASPRSRAGRFAYVWYGPQTAPSARPTATSGSTAWSSPSPPCSSAPSNPFGNGFFQGPKEAPLEAATACAGVYGKGAYPGFPGELLVDPATGASYNAHGARGRKYLVPALVDPDTSACSTLG